jgi:hypothetical protein
VFELSLRALFRARRDEIFKKMGDHKELPIYKAGYDLVLEVFGMAFMP